MDRLIAADKLLTRILEWIMIGFFAFFLVLVVVMVVMRYVFNTGILGGDEFVTICFIVTSALGGAVCVSRREHIAITYFIDFLPRLQKTLVYALGLLIMAAVNVVMAYLSIDWIQGPGRFPWQPFGFARGIVFSMIPIGCGFAALFCLIKAALAIGGRERVDVLWLPED